MCSGKLRVVAAALGVAVPAIVAPALALTRLASALATRMMGTRLERIDRFDDRVDRVWASASKRYPVIAVRDHREAFAQPIHALERG